MATAKQENTFRDVRRCVQSLFPHTRGLVLVLLLLVTFPPCAKGNNTSVVILFVFLSSILPSYPLRLSSIMVKAIGPVHSFMPDDAIVRMMLLWLKMKIPTGTSIMKTETAAPMPARAMPPAMIWLSA